MSKRMTKRQREMKAGIWGFFGLLLFVGIFVIFLGLIPSMITTLAGTLAITEDIATWLLLGIFVAGFIFVTYMSYITMRK